jgi:hypothetical protein
MRRGDGALLEKVIAFSAMAGDQLTLTRFLRTSQLGAECGKRLGEQSRPSIAK